MKGQHSHNHIFQNLLAFILAFAPFNFGNVAEINENFLQDDSAGIHFALANSPSIGSCQIFPGNNFWNIPINNLPVHTSSGAWINSIGPTRGFHMDFGSGAWDGGPIGIPYNIVSVPSATYNVDFYYPDESDLGPYPIPANPQIEWGSDHHILIIDTTDCILYEIYDAWIDNGQWFGGSGAMWDLDSNMLRTDGWTSADAAGLPIFPGLARYDEIVAGEINHAIRFTTNCTANYYIWPARHRAQSGNCATPVPFGARFRLKANYDISTFSEDLQIILRAMKTYGIVLADNGSPWYVSGAPDERWDNDMLHELDVLTGNDFEAVDTTALIVNPNSGEANNAFGPPQVSSITASTTRFRTDPTVIYTVTFSEDVTGVDASDFTLSAPGLVNSSITSVNGSGTAYTISVFTGTGKGTIHIDLIDNDSIRDADLIPLSGTGTGNGSFLFAETLPVVASSLASSPTVKGKAVDPSQKNEISPLETTTAAIPLDEQANSVEVWTNPAFENITITDLIPPSAPKRRSPINMAILSGTPTFHWTKVSGGAVYQFQYDNNLDFSSPTFTASTSNTHYRPLQMYQGIYFWRIRARNTNGSWSEWSPTYKVTINK